MDLLQSVRKTDSAVIYPRVVMVFVWFALAVPLAPTVDAQSESNTESNVAAGQHRHTALVVCPSSLEPALTGWQQLRREQGIETRVIGSRRVAAELMDDIRSSARPSDRFLLIVGDAPVVGSSADPTIQVPLHYLKTTVSKRFGSTPTMGSDQPYSDLDGDGVSDLAVGRIPVDTPQELNEFIDRIRAYESSGDFSSWRERVQLVGGVGGFGVLADSTIESVTRMMVTASLPTPVRTSVAYGSPGHLFYPSKRFTESVVERYGRGCRFWVYAGHGTIDRLDNVPSGPTGIPVLDGKSIDRLQCDPSNAPIAVLLCCFTGAIDASVDSFAEQMLKHRCGPIAVIAGNRVTMPYGNASLTLGLIDSVYGRGNDFQPAERLGYAWLTAIRQLQRAEQNDKRQLQTMLDTVAMLISPAGTKLADERAEHAALYGLLGDPLLKLHPPTPVRVETKTGFDFGAPIVVTVTSPIDGLCTVTIDHPLGERRPADDQRSIDPNEITLASESRMIQADELNQFSIVLDETRPGAVLIRVHVAGAETWAAGGAKTNIRPAKESSR